MLATLNSLLMTSKVVGPSSAVTPNPESGSRLPWSKFLLNVYELRDLG